ncbi:hypothetical protein [Edaphobacter aggregans]|uniref:hypothetical protein n=1 Tax=Edaphobacter aggregans TaxID=570835 RepID=UPI00055342FA|nr:hypothetical protein [Edaphobacter aggregans]
MELLLNLLWFSVSLLLVAFWVRAVRLGHTQLTWTTFVALALLLVLLFPVISMTDDLVAMAAPSEGEHFVRRVAMPLLHLDQDSSSLLDTVLLAALLFLGIAFLSLRLSRLVPRSYPRTVLAGFARAAAVRPPPVALLAA